MTERLIQAELRTVGDVAELDTAEAAELFGELRAAAVPLGDRARLRKASRGHQQRGEPGEQSAMMFQSGSLLPSHKTIGDKTTNAHHRQLQSGGGVSIEVAAIAFTGRGHGGGATGQSLVWIALGGGGALVVRTRRATRRGRRRS